MPTPPAQPTWVGAALRQPRYLLTRWPWRALGHTVVTGLALAVLAMPVALALSPLAARGTGVRWWVGLAASLPLLAVVAVVLAPLTARFEVARLPMIDARPAALTAEPQGWRARWRHRLTERSAWLAVVHFFVLVTAGSAAQLGLMVVGGTALGMVVAPVLVRVVPDGVGLGLWQVTTAGQAWVACALGLPLLAVTGYLVGVVAAGHDLLARLLLVALLERTGFEVVASLPDADALLAAVEQHRPDLVVTDIRMPPGFSDEGLRAAVAIRERHDARPVVALSQYVERSYAGQLLDSCGGRGVGYLLKDRVTDIPVFVQALRTVAGGGTIIDPDVVRQLLRRPDPVASLTEREREVLSLVAEGHSNSALAQRLYLSEAAIAKHIGTIFTKLDLPMSDDTNRRVLAVLAFLRQ